jgi:hypothetical protein
MVRVDRQANRLWDVRQELWRRENSSLGLESSWRFDDPPDLHALAALYRLDPGAPAVEEGADANDYLVTLDGARIRFKEDRYWVRAIVEGRLPEGRLAAFQAHLLTMLSSLDASEWEIEPD